MSKRPEPVELGQIWQYGAMYHREGRFQVLDRTPYDLWRCREVTSAREERNYTTDQILDMSSLTKIQIGQLWLNSVGNEVEILQPLPPRTTFTPAMPFYMGSTSRVSGAWWRCRQQDGTEISVSEDSIFSLWTMVVLPPGVTSSDKCPLCGRPCKQFFNFVECITPSCPNHRKI